MSYTVLCAASSMFIPLVYYLVVLAVSDIFTNFILIFFTFQVVNAAAAVPISLPYYILRAYFTICLSFLLVIYIFCQKM